MSQKRRLIALLAFLSLMIFPFAVQAATITACTFNKETYLQGETGYLTVTMYNDQETKIKVTELSATINYYYTDENVYIHKFHTNATLPLEIQPGTSRTFYIPFSLPINIAPGYTNVYVKGITELWNPQSEIWFASAHPTYQPLLYIESPYKEESEEYQQQLEEQVTVNEQLEDQLDEQQIVNEQLEGQLEEQQTANEQLEDQLDEQQTANEQLEDQLEEQLVANKNVTNMVYLFGVATLVLGAVVVFLFIVNRRVRVFTQPIA